MTTNTGEDETRPADRAERFVDDAREVFAALSSETRLRIVLAIRGSSTGECVSDVAATLEVNQSTVSQGLSQLYRAGLVTRRREGRKRYYTTTVVADRLLAAVPDDP